MDEKFYSKLNRSLILASMSSANAENRPSEGNAASLSISIGIITDNPDHHDFAQFSVTTALTYCNTKILKPYLRFLSITGLRSFINDANEGFTISACFCYIYICMLMILMLLGYCLQYASCFRRDRGFSYILLSAYANDTFSVNKENLYQHICDEPSLFIYAFPHVLHFVGYLHAFHVFRSSNDDQLPSLMESVFLTLTNLSDGFQSQKRLVRTLWMFVAVSLIWMTSSLITITIMMGMGDIYFKWIHLTDPRVLLALKILLVLSSLIHDVVQTTVISNYCLQAQLLTSYIHFLRAKLLQHSVMSTEWMRDMEEFKKLLSFLNSKLAPSVCIFTLLNVCRGITGVMWLFNLDVVEKNNWCAYWVRVVNIILWITLAVAPFIQAARLTNACSDIRGVGQELRVRPFPQRSMNSDSTKQLDSLMLYSSSLRLRARLFGIAIKPSYLFFLLTVTAIMIIVLGQLHYLK